MRSWSNVRRHSSCAEGSQAAPDVTAQVERRLLTEMVTVGGGMVLSQQSQRGPDADSEEEEAALGAEEHQLGPTNLVVMGRHAQQQALLKRLAREGVPAVRCVQPTPEPLAATCAIVPAPTILTSLL